MGADGWVNIYDAKRIDEDGLRYKFFRTFQNVNESRMTLPKHFSDLLRYFDSNTDWETEEFHVYTTYWDTEHHNLFRSDDETDVQEEDFGKYLIGDDMMMWT